MRARVLVSLLSAITCGVLVGLAPGLSAQARRPAAKSPAAPKAAAAPKANPVVSLVGLQVAAKSLGKARFGDTIAFGGQAGVSLALAVRVAPGTVLLDIDDDDATVDTWTDDKQTDLNIEPDWGSFPNFTEDLSAGIITVRSPVVPAAGAQQVSIAGTVAVTTAAGSSAVQAKKVALAKGTAFKLGTLAASISEFEATDTGATLAVKLIGGNTNSIKRLRFLDAAGTELESDTNGSMTSSNESEYSYTLKAKATTATIELELWQNQQTTKVPFTLNATLGSVKGS
jgi:hypothetical protein